MTRALRILFRILAFAFFLIVWCVLIALGSGHHRGSRRDRKGH